VLRHKPAKRIRISNKLAGISAALLIFTSPWSLQNFDAGNSVVNVSLPAPPQALGSGTTSGQQDDLSSSSSAARRGFNLSRMIFKLY